MDMMMLARSLGGLTFVLALLSGALWAVKRFDIALPGRVGVRSRGRLGVVERVSIDKDRSLILLHKDGVERWLLLSPEGHVLLDEGDAPGKAPDFADAMRTADASPVSSPVRSEDRSNASVRRTRRRAKAPDLILPPLKSAPGRPA